MMKIKKYKILALILALAMLPAVFGACTREKTPGADEPTTAAGAKDAGALKIVATVFPQYDWIRQILGENPAGIELTLLLGSGSDLHSYQPTMTDLLTIYGSDLFVYVGGESDKWVDDAMNTKPGDSAVVAVNLLAGLGDAVKEEEVKEGMQAEEEGEEGEEEAEYDEHVWLSLKNAAALTRGLAERIGALDPQNKAVYTANADA